MDALNFEREMNTIRVGFKFVIVMFLYCSSVSCDYCSLVVLGISVLYTVDAILVYRERLMAQMPRQQDDE
ncbi:hypothetical protein CAEBREN_13605 [Caenorhabditis brenneri]|uniref:Uncharacterized protein n=1 Tax=Caenorhabditis brenneri TaxID=135651 RepID=G0N550_CAEBE|nr:hypothetical protein CAEBREN_13605 [Caenorhabditis brenneri]